MAGAAILSHLARSRTDFCKESARAVPDLGESHPPSMNTPLEYSLFGHPVSRRLFVWSIFLCPGLALAIYLSTRSRRVSVQA